MSLSANISNFVSGTNNNIPSVVPRPVPKAPKTGQMATKTAGFEVSDETMKRANKVCNYYHVVEGPDGNCIVQGNCVIQGAVQRWYKSLKKGGSFEDCCVYSPALRVCCTKKIFLKLAVKVCRDLSTQGYNTTPEKLLESCITIQNYNGSESYKDEISKYNSYREKNQTKKPRQQRTDLSKVNLGDLSKEMTLQLKSGGTMKKNSRGTHTLEEQIKMVRENPSYKYSVVDVSNFGTRYGSNCGKLISIAEAKSTKRICVSEIKVASRNPGSFRKAMNYLGDEYKHYATEFDDLCTRS